MLDSKYESITVKSVDCDSYNAPPFSAAWLDMNLEPLMMVFLVRKTYTAPPVFPLYESSKVELMIVRFAADLALMHDPDDERSMSS